MWPIIGHEWAVELLERCIRAGTTSHAYLIAGPTQVGKTTLARAFAQAVLCRSESNRRGEGPCGICRACQLVLADRHPDVSLVAPEGGRVKIEAIRELQQMLSLSPVEGDHRFSIIRRFDVATPSAANCLLKTLEEPPPRVILLLTADRIDALLPTIVSRCQILSLRAVAAERIAAALLERGVGAERAQLLASLAQGRVGWAIEASQDERVLVRREQILEKLLGLDERSYRARFLWADQLSRDPDRVPEVLGVLSSWWHDVLVLASGSGASILNRDRQPVLQEWAARYGVDTAQQVLRGIQDAGWQLEHNANRRLALEVLLMDLPSKR
jgi:DNA polymerase-3 subunit delta'